MTDVQRPALAPVLAALTDLPMEVWAVWLAEPPSPIEVYDHSACVRLAQWRPQGYAMGPVAWITRDPAEAWEILDARGLLPPDGSRGFWCRRVSYDTPDGYVDRPATIPDIVAWASLGAEAIVTAEALCCEIAPALARVGVVTDRCERVVWRVRDTSQGVRGPIVDYWQRRDGATVLMADGTLDVPNGFSSFKRETIAPVRALWDMGLALERVGAECVLCAPPIGGSRG